MLLDISGWLYNVFGPYGGWGVLLCVFLIFFIDAIIFPTLPELFFIIGFMYDPTPIFGVELLLIAILAEVTGISLLYYVVDKIRVPQRIKKIADSYVKFLIVSDEKAILMNRIAPMLPFVGAFISLIDSWKLSRALFYVVVGCILKYGLILLMSGLFYKYFSGPDAQTTTMTFVIAIMILSFVFAIYKKKKKEKNIDENC